jgi:hypothetical protein
MEVMKPPPVLSGARVLEYAIVGDSAKFTGQLRLYVDGTAIGAVPRLAICENLDDGELLLLHCDDDWNVVGVQAWNTPEGSAAKSVEDVKAHAATCYAGINEKWQGHGATLEDAKAYQAELVGDARCSFCGRTTHDIHALLEAESGARICDLCIRKFYEELLAK